MSQSTRAFLLIGVPLLLLRPFLLASPPPGPTDPFAGFRQPPPGREGLAARLPLTLDAAGKPVTTRDGWQARREALRRRWVEIIGPFPRRVSLDPKVLSTEELPDHTRILVRYQADPVWKAEAYLLIPKDAKGGGGEKARRPGVVVLHQTSDTHCNDPVGLAGRETMHMGLHLVRRGYVCVAPRNFLWGLGDKDKDKGEDDTKWATARVLEQEPWKTGMAKMTWDAIRATDLLMSRPEVDPDRIGSIGHSLGGKEALYHAAFDERINATVSCEGGVGLSFSNWEAPWYLGEQIKAPEFRHDHEEVIALIAPRAFLLIGGESADGAQSWPYVEANLPVWKLYDAEAKLGLMRHGFGHDFPPPGQERERVYDWMDRWLGRDRR